MDVRRQRRRQHAIRIQPHLLPDKIQHPDHMRPSPRLVRRAYDRPLRVVILHPEPKLSATRLEGIRIHPVITPMHDIPRPPTLNFHHAMQGWFVDSDENIAQIIPQAIQADAVPIDICIIFIRIRRFRYSAHPDANSCKSPVARSPTQTH